LSTSQAAVACGIRGWATGMSPFLQINWAAPLGAAGLAGDLDLGSRYGKAAQASIATKFGSSMICSIQRITSG